MNKLKLSIVMILWGSVGVFTRNINLSPISLACFRALIAIPALYIFYRMQKNKVQLTFKKSLPYIISGALIGFAWTTLFLAFDNTSISSAILVYNMCPVYVMIAAPFILKERLNKIQIITVIVSFIGLYIIVSSDMKGSGFNMKGLSFGIVSGLMYAFVVMFNRKIKSDYDSTTITFIQIISATVALIPFVFIEGKIGLVFELDLRGIILLIILGIVHTGIAYYLYFSAFEQLDAITIVSFSYLEPVFSIIFSVLILSEVLTINQIMGGCLILGSTYLSEYLKARGNKKIDREPMWEVELASEE